MHYPRVVIAGLSGGTGKTLVSLGLVHALAGTRLRVKTFKKGPDYIDASWLGLAADSPKGNLDPYFSSPDELLKLFAQGAAGYDVSIIEGNRGFFDGVDVAGSCSTAFLSRVLHAPVILVVDCTKMTRTAAALVYGCMHFEPDTRISGVILNKTGTCRQRELIAQAVEESTGVRVLGALPRHPAVCFDERHMGLMRADLGVSAKLKKLADIVRDCIDLDAVAAIARSAPALPGGVTGAAAVFSGAATAYAPAARDENPDGLLTPAAMTPDAQDRSSTVLGELCPENEIHAVELTTPETQAITQVITQATAQTTVQTTTQITIGYVQDAAFWLYYQENMDALQRCGATLVPVSCLEERDWPVLQGLYIGGGVPELYAAELSKRVAIRRRVAALSSSGLPVYAEGGGFAYLSKSLRCKGRNFSMAGVFPGEVHLHERPQGLGYIEAEVVAANPYHPQGFSFRAHEFHFSRYAAPQPSEFLLRLHKGTGIQQQDGLCWDGLISRMTYASYAQVYAPSVPHWAPAFVEACRKYAWNIEFAEKFL